MTLPCSYYYTNQVFKYRYLLCSHKYRYFWVILYSYIFLHNIVKHNILFLEIQLRTICTHTLCYTSTIRIYQHNVLNIFRCNMQIHIYLCNICKLHQHTNSGKSLTFSISFTTCVWDFKGVTNWSLSLSYLTHINTWKLNSNVQLL